MIGIESENLGVGHALVKRGEQRGVGAVEPIDGLIRVPDTKKRCRRGQEFLNEEVLHGVHVLKLINEEMARAPMNGCCECWVAQGPNGFANQVIKIQSVARTGGFFVAQPKMLELIGGL